MLGMLRRNLHFCSETTRERAYFALVRPYVEYACSLWDPYTADHIKSIEMVQRRAVRFVYQNYKQEPGTVTGLLQKSNWLSLSSRRKICSMSFIYKMIHEEVDVPFNNFFRHKTTRTRNNHSLMIYRERPKKTTGVIVNSFYYKAPVHWNDLTENVVSAPSLESFKGRIGTLYRDREGLRANTNGSQQ